MPRLRRLAALLVATLAGTLAIAPVAAAAPAPAAARAADFIVTRLQGDHLSAAPAGFPSDQSLTADGVIALSATGGHGSEVAAMTKWLSNWAKGQASIDAATAAHLTLAAAAAGANPSDFGGVDLPASISWDASGSIGWGDPYTQSLAILAIVRARAEVPTIVIEALLKQQVADGGFGYEGLSDSDNTGISLQALLAVSGKSPAAAKAAAKAVAWARSHKTAADGGYYWPGYSPVNSTAVVAPALRAAGVDVSGAEAWLRGQQLADGGLPATLDGGASDLLATLQGTLVLARGGYLTVGGPTAARLPNTGAPLAAPALLGALVAVIGGGLVAVARRRSMQ